MKVGTIGTMQIKLPTLKPTTIKLSSPHVLTTLRNTLALAGEKNKSVQDGLGILTPATSPEVKSPKPPEPSVMPPVEPMDTRPDT